MVIGLILHGHSIKELEANIKKFKNKWMWWGTINRVEPANKILKKINTEVDFVVAFAPQYKSRAFSCRKVTESKARGNSLHEFLLQCLDTDTVILFGADGYSDNDKPYCDDWKGFTVEQIRGHKIDTERLNKTFPKVKTKIYNTSMDSHYKPFKKVPLNEVLDYIPNKG